MLQKHTLWDERTMIQRKDDMVAFSMFYGTVIFFISFALGLAFLVYSGFGPFIGILGAVAIYMLSRWLLAGAGAIYMESRDPVVFGWIYREVNGEDL